MKRLIPVGVIVCALVFAVSAQAQELYGQDAVTEAYNGLNKRVAELEQLSTNVNQGLVHVFFLLNELRTNGGSKLESALEDAEQKWQVKVRAAEEEARKKWQDQQEKIQRDAEVQRLNEQIIELKKVLDEAGIGEPEDQTQEESADSNQTSAPEPESSDR
jgi:rRNA maturation endonuclease Nob1